MSGTSTSARPPDAADTVGRLLDQRWIGFLAIWLAVLIWGGWFPLSRLAVTTNLTPADLALLRFAVPALLLLPVAIRKGLRANRAGYSGSLLMAATVGAPFPLLLGMGLETAPAAHAAVLVPGVFPAITFVLGVILLKNRATPRQILGVVLVALGVAFVGWAATSATGVGELRGYLWFHLCAWMWSIFTITARYARITPLHATAIISIVSMIFFLPWYLIFMDSRLPELPLGELLFQIFYQGLLAGLLALVAYSHAVNVLGAGQAAVFGGMVPCIAALVAVPVLGELLGPREIIGLLLVTLGIINVTGARLPWRSRRGGRARPEDHLPED